MPATITWFALSILTAIGATFTLVQKTNANSDQLTPAFVAGLYFIPFVLLLMGIMRCLKRDESEHAS